MYCSSPRIWGGLVICFVQLNVVTVCSCEPRSPEVCVFLLETYLASCEEVQVNLLEDETHDSVILLFITSADNHI